MHGALSAGIHVAEEWLSYEKQVAQLRERGMEIRDATATPKHHPSAALRREVLQRPRHILRRKPGP